MRNRCTCCGDPIFENSSFEADDEEIFEAVAEKVDEGQCYECALTSALIEQGQNETDHTDFY